MYKICFYVPESHIEIVKNKMFASGAGRIGNYGCCSWQILGEGQFMALAGSDPYVGTENKLEKLNEYKVEMICADEYLKAAIIALRASHPYEEPAYQVWRIENV